MKIKMKRNRVIDGKRRTVGTIVEVDDETAVHFLKLGDAVAVKVEPETATNKKKQTADMPSGKKKG